MRIFRFAVIASLVVITVSGCAGNRKNQRSGYRHHHQPAHSNTAEQYLADPPLYSEPAPSVKGPTEPVPVPPAIGVSHVKQVSHTTTVGFGSSAGCTTACAVEPSCVSPPCQSACGENACVSEPTCGESSGGCLSSMGRFWGALCPKRTGCVEESCCETLKITCNPHPLCCPPRTACVPHVECVQEYCQPICTPGCGTEAGCSPDSACAEGCTAKKSCTLPKLKFPKLKMPTCQLPSMKMPSFRLPSYSMPKIKMPKMKMPSMPCCWKGFCSPGCGDAGCGDVQIDNGCGSACGSECGVEPTRIDNRCQPSHGLSPLAGPLQDPFAGSGPATHVPQPYQEEPRARQAVPQIPQHVPAQPAQGDVGAPQSVNEIPVPATPAESVMPVPAEPQVPANGSQTFVEPQIWPRLKPAATPYVNSSNGVRAWSTTWQSNN